MPSLRASPSCSLSPCLRAHSLQDMFKQLSLSPLLPNSTAPPFCMYASHDVSPTFNSCGEIASTRQYSYFWYLATLPTVG